MRIGEIAALVGVTTRAIRHYHHVGLLPEPVTLELTRPLPFVRPLGAEGETRTVRFHADDPRALVTALTRGRTGSSPSPGRPA